MEQEKMLWCLKKLTDPSLPLPYYAKMGQRSKSVIDEWIERAERNNKTDMCQSWYITFEKENEYTIAVWKLKDEGFTVH